MRRLPPRASRLVLPLGILLIGCNSDQPSMPASTDLDPRDLGEPECGTVRGYLEELDPVLVQWEGAIEEWFVDDALATPPTLADTTSNEEYLAAVSSTLGDWETTLETVRTQDFLPTVPPFEPGMTQTVMYLETLSPILSSWQVALDEWRGEPFVDAPPTLALDTTPPEIACASDTTVVTSSEDGVTVEFVLAATDLCDTDPTVVCDPPSGSIFPAGETSVTCTATDEAGNSAECTFRVNVEVAMVTITCPPDTTVACAGPEGTPVEFVVTADDGLGGSLDATCDPASGTLFPLGDTTVSCSAADTLGNEATCTFVVTVTDTIPPEIACPDDLLVPCGTITGVAVEFDVLATDACGGDVVVTSDPESGSFFPIGDTTVTSTATDAAGNASSCEFTVTVEEAAPPEIEDVVASPSMLWPPNDRMVEIDLDYVLGETCGEVICVIDEVESNEPIDGLGDGNTEPDWMVTEAILYLRAERAGTGSGRTYIVHVTCRDELGQETADVVEIVVPHDRR